MMYLPTTIMEYKMSLFRKALEGELIANAEGANVDTGSAAAAADQTRPTETTVIMTGPLSQAYTQALAITFAKPVIEEKEPGTETTALESQANDAIMEAGALKVVTGSEADTIQNPDALIYGVSAQQLGDDTIVDVAKRISEFELQQPEEFIVVIDATEMASITDNKATDLTESSGVSNTYQASASTGEPSTDTKDDVVVSTSNLPVLESLVVGMGGRVVYSLKQALECIAELRKEEVIEVPVVNPTGEPIAEAGASDTEPAKPTEEVVPPEEVAAPAEEVSAGVNEVPDPESAIALEADKGDKKKKEHPKSKLNRAKNLISGVIPNIKETALRAELHHAIGIILSAVKDIK